MTKLSEIFGIERKNVEDTSYVDGIRAYYNGFNSALDLIDGFEMSEYRLREIVAQQWCLSRNSRKIFDPELAEDIVQGVINRANEWIVKRDNGIGEGEDVPK